MHAIQMALSGMIYIHQVHEDWYRHSSDIKVLPQQLKWP
jgi:hypothetical protein